MFSFAKLAGTLLVNMGAPIICFIGIDGSGKSTLADRIRVWLLEQNVNVRNIHSYHEPLLLRPAKWLARLLFMRKVSQHHDYAAYKSQKSQAASRHRYSSFLYGMLWLFDYSFQTLFFVSLNTLTAGLIILDRYIYDVAVNISVSLDWGEAASWRLIEKWLRIYPRPVLVYLIDLPEQIAFSRKTDIPSIHYLSERRSRYLALAQQFGFRILDGQLPLESLEQMIRCDISDHVLSKVVAE